MCFLNLIQKSKALHFGNAEITVLKFLHFFLINQKPFFFLPLLNLARIKKQL